MEYFIMKLFCLVCKRCGLVNSTYLEIFIQIRHFENVLNIYRRDGILLWNVFTKCISRRILFLRLDWLRLEWGSGSSQSWGRLQGQPEQPGSEWMDGWMEPLFAASLLFSDLLKALLWIKELSRSIHDPDQDHSVNDGVKHQGVLWKEHQWMGKNPLKMFSSQKFT